MYSVKEAAEILGVSVHTVRYYDDSGLIPEVQRDKNNHRVFSDSSLEWLFICVTLRSTGLSVKEIKRYVDLYQQGDLTLKERYDLMRAQRDRVLLELEDLKRRLKLLDRKVEYYGGRLAGGEDFWDHDFIQDLIWRRSQNDS